MLAEKILWIQSRDLFLEIGLTEEASIFQNGLNHLEKKLKIPNTYLKLN